jgi:hypothetical protein|tara:strand:+ start:5331 stop:5615 length:285 start_codon:yes stop_codon:yes gene_type:complete
MKGRKSRASGGVNEAAEDLGRKNMRYTYESNVNKEAVERKRGGKIVGKVKGMDAMHHAGRMARKSGGSCDNGSPFSSARHGTPAKGRNVSGSIN